MVRGISTAPPTVIFTSSTATLLLPSHFIQPSNSYFWQARISLWSPKSSLSLYTIACDISIVHKPGKVVTEMGRRNVYALTSAERGKTHSVLACVSASGYVLPPMLIYRRKRWGLFFATSESGCMDQFRAVFRMVSVFSRAYSSYQTCPAAKGWTCLSHIH